MMSYCKRLKIKLFFLLIPALSLGLIPPLGMLSQVVGVQTVQANTLELDLFFVIDNSGSMKKNDPKFITPDVVSIFVRQLPPQTRVGMVLFDQNARLLKPLTLVSDPQAQTAVIDSLKGVDYRGQFTNTPAGIERALYELKTKARKSAQKGIVLITDGIVDTGDTQKDIELTQWLKDDVTTQCKLLGVRIFGIALTEAADFSLIQTLASRTHGEYFRTYAASEISEVLQQIQIHLAPRPVIAPLPLLPVPEEKPEMQQASVPPAEVKPQSVPTPQAADNAPVVTGKSIWMISLTTGLVIFALIATLIFFYIQMTRRKGALGPVQGKKITVPDAQMEDLDNVLGNGALPYKLEEERINVGRSTRNQFIINEPAISSFHATIEFRNMAFYLEDQRSTNGTLLNDTRLQPNDAVRLKSGDRITFATYNFKFFIADQSPFGDTVMLSMTALEDEEAADTVVLDLNNMGSKQGLISCMQNHLIQIYGLSPKHKTYVNTYFAHDILDIIATTAHDNLQKSQGDSEQHCSPIVKNKAFYVVCSLPVAIDAAVEWYGRHFSGFTQFIFKWIRSQEYQAAECDQLCVITFGQDPATWVSITIVPTHSEDHPVEIMSVDFLNDEEKTSLALDFDNHGRVV